MPKVKRPWEFVIADLDNDGLPDIYVANDTTPNFLFINHGAGRFIESAQKLGCAVNREGLPQASMGIAVGDYDRNGWLDLCCTNFTKESATLFKNLGDTGFKDVTLLVGLRQATFKSLGFGTLMEDFNQDGREDLFFANGYVDETASTKNEAYEMEAQLFSLDGSRFVECSKDAGDYFSEKHVGRAVARGDYDNDGDWDLVVVHHNELAVILRNDSQRGHWLKLRFQSLSNRRGIGTRVVLSQEHQLLTQELAGGVSYCAAQEPALIFGLGENSSHCDLQIRWPDGTAQILKDVAVDQSLVIKQPAKN